MVQTADELDLGIGRRFPAAELCACALLAENSRALPSRCLAQELSTLIFDIWWTALWWPREYLGFTERVYKTLTQPQASV